MPEDEVARYQISPESAERLNDLHDKFTKDIKTHLGFPANILYDYSDLHRFFAFTINNAGDPFSHGLYQINTHQFEREVVTFFANLYNAPKDGYWGHVTNGGTEGNLYGLYLARGALPDGIVYYSQESHYSIPKALRLMGVFGNVIKSLPNGEINYLELEHTILKNHKPPIIIATIGTTMRGAVDRPAKILDILRRNKINKYYIHCDSALGGMILPFTENSPIFDFRLPICSISVSGHKMIGSPIPCGITIARKEYIGKVSRDIELIGSPDTTLSGSRNGHSVLFMWYAIQRFGLEGFKKMIQHCFKVKAYALERLSEISWPAQTEEFSVAIVIKKPSLEIVKKWQLAVHADIAHILVMPNINLSQIDAFIEDLKKEV